MDSIVDTLVESLGTEISKKKRRVASYRSQIKKAATIEVQARAQANMDDRKSQLRRMRQQVFDAGVELGVAVEQGSAAPFEPFAANFPDTAQKLAEALPRHTKRFAGLVWVTEAAG